MLLPSVAVLLLGALQPALGKPSLRRRQKMDGSKNAIGAQRVTPTEIAIDYFAPNPPCGPHRPWVGVWPADACNPYTADYVADEYVERTEGRDMRTVTINLTELDAGEYKAAFVCEDGKRKPWLVSQTFKVEDEPPAKKKQGQRCFKSDECEAGFFCKHQCGGPVEDYSLGMCFIAGQPTCRPLPKKEGERCDKESDCGRGLYCRHQCGGRIDDSSSRPSLCLTEGEPRCAKE